MIVGGGGDSTLFSEFSVRLVCEWQCRVLLRPFPSLLHRLSLPNTSPFLPGWGVGLPWRLVVFCFSCFALASAVLAAVLPRWGPF